jgi:transcriptional regulator with XRE-family HTH domain
MDLAELRRRAGLTQAQVAASMGTAQPNVSRLERGDVTAADIATLRRYLEAVGGRLRLVAEVSDQQYVLW